MTQRNISILYFQFFDPFKYPPLIRSAAILYENGCNIKFVGLREANLKNPSVDNAMKYDLNPSVEEGLKQKILYLKLLYKALKSCCFKKNVIVYISNDLAAPLGVICKFLFRMKVVYHEHDSPSISKSTSIFMKICYSARQKLLKYADIVIFPNSDRMAISSEGLNKKNHWICSWNCPDIKEVVDIEVLHKRNNDKLNIVYSGSINKNRLQYGLLESLSLLDIPYSLKIIGYETIDNRGYINDLIKKSHDLKIAHNIEFCGHLSHDKMINCLRSCHVGVNLLSPAVSDVNLKFLLGAGVKVFDYLAQGLMVLMDSNSDWFRHFGRKFPFFLYCDLDSKKSVASALRWCWDNPELLKEAQLIGRNKILDEWNYQTQYCAAASKISTLENK